MTWQRDDLAMYGNEAVRIESGPWEAGRPDLPSHTRYLVQVEANGRYRFAEARLLRTRFRPIPVGFLAVPVDMVRVQNPWLVHHRDDEVVTLSRRMANYPDQKQWRSVAADLFDAHWTRYVPKEG